MSKNHFQSQNQKEDHAQAKCFQITPDILKNVVNNHRDTTDVELSIFLIFRDNFTNLSDVLMNRISLPIFEFPVPPFNFRKPLKVVADTANGMGGLVVPAVFEALPFELDHMYPELDGTFPNHPADPIQPENQQDLMARVLETGADIGLAFDGDADRVFLVDETARAVSGSPTTAMVGRSILAKNPAARYGQPGVKKGMIIVHQGDKTYAFDPRADLAAELRKRGAMGSQTDAFLNKTEFFSAFTL